jgi:hypothetical protein
VAEFRFGEGVLRQLNERRGIRGCFSHTSVMEAKMTARQLRDLPMSVEYKRDVEELSSYVASIAPERPMLHCLAKHLWNGRHNFQLEAKLKDLVIDGKHIEFKGSYDFGMEKLDVGLKKAGVSSLKAMYEMARDSKRSIGWNVGLKVYEDICEKTPDMFVWIICSRDLSEVDPDDRKRICMSNEQWKWNNRGHSYPDQTYLPIADSFLKRLQDEIISERCAVKPFSILEAEFVTKGDFASTYHFRICDFT